MKAQIDKRIINQLRFMLSSGYRGSINGGLSIGHKTKKARTKYHQKHFINLKTFYTLYTDSPSIKVSKNQFN